MLFIAIIIFEIAYNKDSTKIGLIGIEILVLSLNILLTWNIINKKHISTQKYIIYSSIIFLGYYVIKSMLIYTKGKKQYLNSLSDIHEIVKKEPIKKEAKKREE